MAERGAPDAHEQLGGSWCGDGDVCDVVGLIVWVLLDGGVGLVVVGGDGGRAHSITWTACIFSGISGATILCISLM